MRDLKRIISSPRLEAYRRHAAESDLDCLERYVWNIALSEALYPLLQHLEVGLRNGIHNAASRVFNNACWFDNRGIINDAKTLDVIASARAQLTKRNKPHEADRIVAELHFGFWATLFYNRYEQVLWRPIIKDAFPNMPTHTRTRKVLSSRVQAARELRNRISHHEPIWHWDLQQQHQKMLETLGWISAPLEALARETDRFSEVYVCDGDVYRTRLEKLI